jgi:hypothetical protein
MSNLRFVLGTLLIYLTTNISVHAQTIQTTRRSSSSTYSQVEVQDCTPLDVIGAQGTEVTKTVSAPGIILTRDNWNTDFVVPNNNGFWRYVAILTSESDKKANFTVEMFLKYGNGTSDKTFEGNVGLEPGESREIVSSPRIEQQPYQVNLSVGGIGSVGKAYRLSVQGCN